MSLPKLVHGIFKKTVNCRHRQHGFTLIELLVVITIIGILLSVATVSWSNAQEKSRDSKRKSDLKSVQQALELYFQDNGTYPPSNTTNGLIQCPNTPPTDISWGGNFTCTTPTAATYMNPIPKDPRGGTTGTPAITHDYYYEADVSSTPDVYLQYRLHAGLENDNDPENCTSATCVADGKLPCQPRADKNYCVQQP